MPTMDFQPTAYIRMLSGRIRINATSATALQCGSSNLAGRKWLFVDNSTNVPIFIGSQYLSAGTPTTIDAHHLGKWGIKLAASERVWLPISDNITVYARTNSGSRDVRIMELA